MELGSENPDFSSKADAEVVRSEGDRLAAADHARAEWLRSTLTDFYGPEKRSQDESEIAAIEAFARKHEAAAEDARQYLVDATE